MANKYTAWKPDLARLKALYDEGRTQEEVGTILGVSQKMVWGAMRRLGLTARVAAKRDQRGERNQMWRGDKAKYAALHLRVQALRGKPKKCEVCGTQEGRKTYDWANLTGRFNDPSDYKRMCRSCHWKYDKKHLNLGSHAIRKGGVSQCP